MEGRGGGTEPGIGELAGGVNSGDGMLPPFPLNDPTSPRFQLASLFGQPGQLANPSRMHLC